MCLLKTNSYLDYCDQNSGTNYSSKSGNFASNFNNMSQHDSMESSPQMEKQTTTNKQIQQLQIEESEMMKNTRRRKCCPRKAPLRVYFTVAIIILLVIVVISLSVTLIITLLNSKHKKLDNSQLISSDFIDENETSTYDYDYDYSDDAMHDDLVHENQRAGNDYIISDVIYSDPGIVYRVNPNIFADSDNDGVGDLNGIREFISYFAFIKVG